MLWDKCVCPGYTYELYCFIFVIKIHVHTDGSCTSLTLDTWTEPGGPLVSRPDGQAGLEAAGLLQPRLTLARLQPWRLQKERFNFTNAFFSVNVQMFWSNIELLGGSDCSSSRAAGVSWFVERSSSRPWASCSIHSNPFPLFLHIFLLFEAFWIILTWWSPAGAASLDPDSY